MRVPSADSVKRCLSLVATIAANDATSIVCPAVLHFSISSAMSTQPAASSVSPIDWGSWRKTKLKNLLVRFMAFMFSKAALATRSYESELRKIPALRALARSQWANPAQDSDPAGARLEDVLP